MYIYIDLNMTPLQTVNEGGQDPMLDYARSRAGTLAEELQEDASQQRKELGELRRAQSLALIKGLRTQIMGLQGPNTIHILAFGP